MVLSLSNLDFFHVTHWVKWPACSRRCSLPSRHVWRGRRSRQSGKRPRQSGRRARQQPYWAWHADADVYVEGLADRAVTRSISEYFVQDQSLSKPTAASARVSGAAQQATSRAARQTASPAAQQATLSTSSGAAATSADVITAVVSAAGAAVNSAAQAVSDRLWSLAVNYGLISDDEVTRRLWTLVSPHSSLVHGNSMYSHLSCPGRPLKLATSCIRCSSCKMKGP